VPRKRDALKDHKEITLSIYEGNHDSIKKMVSSWKYSQDIYIKLTAAQTRADGDVAEIIKYSCERLKKHMDDMESRISSELLQWFKQDYLYKNGKLD